jgi:hypothetical protein
MNLKMMARVPLLTLPLAMLTLDARADLARPRAPSVARPARPSVVAKPTVTKPKAPKVEPDKKEHWVCPMHDGGESDHAGKCSKCGMNLVKEEAK